jgi:hypothetical protein
VSEPAGAPSIYRQVLREDFERLAPELKAFHDVRGEARFAGRCCIDAAGGPAARMLCWLLRLPAAAADAEFAFELSASPEGETWARRFPERTMRSTMRVRDGRLVERIGPVSLWF